MNNILCPKQQRLSAAHAIRTWDSFIEVNILGYNWLGDFIGLLVSTIGVQKWDLSSCVQRLNSEDSYP